MTAVDRQASPPARNPALASYLDRGLQALQGLTALALVITLLWQTKTAHRAPTLVEILIGRLRFGWPAQITPVTDVLLALAPWLAFALFALLQSAILFRRAPMYQYGPLAVLTLTCLPFYNLAGTLMLFGAQERLLVDRGRPLAGMALSGLARLNVLFSVALPVLALLEPRVFVSPETHELIRWATFAVRLGLLAAALDLTRWLLDEPLFSPVPAPAPVLAEGLDSGMMCPACRQAGLVLPEGRWRELVCPTCRHCVLPPAATRTFLTSTLGITRENVQHIVDRGTPPHVQCPSCEQPAPAVTLRGVPVHLCASCPTIGLAWSALPELMTPLAGSHVRGVLARPNPPPLALPAALFLLVGLGATAEVRERREPPCTEGWTGGWQRAADATVTLICRHEHTTTESAPCIRCPRPPPQIQVKVAEYREQSLAGLTLVEGTYRSDARDGAWNYYDETGHRTRETHYVADQLTAETAFLPSGVIEHTGEYEKGVKSGVWKKFDRLGLLASCETWREGKLQSSDCPDLPTPEKSPSGAPLPKGIDNKDLLFGGQSSDWWATRLTKLSQDKSPGGVELLQVTRERAVLNGLVAEEVSGVFAVKLSDETMKLASARTP